MPIEGAAERAIFLDPDEFGSVVSYTKTGAAAVDIDVIFDAEAEAISLGDMDVSSLAPRFLVAVSALPAGSGDGDGVVIEGVSYTVRDIQPDGTGMAVVKLEKP